MRGVVVCFVSLVVALTTGASAQWLNHPDPRIPRLPDGRPNLAAPAPRTPDGKPDLSGVWRAVSDTMCPPARCGLGTVTLPYVDLNAAVPNGLPYRPAAEALVRQRAARNWIDSPLSHCLPLSPILRLTHPLLRQYVQTTDRLLVLHEVENSHRQVLLDGRPLPVDPNPAWLGYSVGRWDNDTLVVQTAGLRDGLWADGNGNPLSDATKLTEKYRRVSVGRLEIELTVDDPKNYTAPWTIVLRQELVPDTELLEYVCAENEKSRQHFVVPPAGAPAER